MIIPDTEEILFRAKNETKNSAFYKQGFILSFIPVCLIVSIYFLFPIIHIYAFLIIVILFYVLLSLITSRTARINYQKYFSNDELAISKDTLYYNICMNLHGEYRNLDSSRKLSEISDVIIKKGWDPTKLIIYFNDGEHIAIHSLYDINGVKDYILSHK